MKFLFTLFILGVAILAQPLVSQAAGVTTLTPGTFKTTINTTSGTVLVDISSSSPNCTDCKKVDDSGGLEQIADGAKIKVYRITTKDNGSDFSGITELHTNNTYPVLRLFNNGVVSKDIPSTDYANVELAKAITNVVADIATPAADPAAAPTKISNPPQVDGSCKLVLITLSAKDVVAQRIKDCDRDIGFDVYLRAFLDQLLPYVMLIALLMIIASGLQYMLSGVAGDTKAARARILGVLGGVVFYFVIELILGIITPGLKIDPTTVPPAVPAPVAPGDPVKSSILLSPTLDGSEVANGDTIQLAAQAVGSKNITYSYTTPDNNQPTIIGKASAPSFALGWDTSSLDDNNYTIVASADEPSITPANAAFFLTTSDSSGDGGDLSSSEISLSSKVQSTMQGIASLFSVDKAAAAPTACYLKSHGTGSNRVPLYKQNKYCNITYVHPNPKILCGDKGNKSCTLQTSGCGIMAAAMVLDFYGVFDGSLQSLAKIAVSSKFRTDSGTAIDFFPYLAHQHEMYGGVIVSKPENKSEVKWNKILSFLKSGRPVILSGQGPAPFTSGGHYIVATGLDSEGNIAVNDSAGDASRDNKTYSQKDIKTHYNRAAVIYPPKVQ